MTRIESISQVARNFDGQNRDGGFRRHSLLLFAAATLTATIACSDAADPSGPGTPTQPPAVASVVVDPPAASVQANDTIRLRATPRSADGAPLPNRPVSWVSLDRSIATVSESGLVTAVRGGVVRIRAASEGRSGEATLTVAGVPVQVTQLQPASIQAGSTGFDLTVRGSGFSAGAVVLWNGQLLPTTFVSATEVRAYVPAPAIEQPAEIRVTVRNQSPSEAAEATFTVVAPPPPVKPVRWVVVSPTDTTLWISPAVGIYGSARLAVRLLDEDGVELTGRQVTWESQDPTIATVDGTGLVVGLRAGTVRIRAGSEGRYGGAEIEVRTVDGARTFLFDGTTSARGPRAHVGTTTWYDEQGRPWPAAVVVSGTLTFRPGPQASWEQTLRFETFRTDQTTPVKVETRTDRGNMLYDVFDGSLILESTVHPGAVLRTSQDAGGAMLVFQSIGSVTGAWVWVLR